MPTAHLGRAERHAFVEIDRVLRTWLRHVPLPLAANGLDIHNDHPVITLLDTPICITGTASYAGR
jgi:hypothetical protein